MSRLLCCASAGSVSQPAGGVLFQDDEGSQDGDHEATVRDELQCLPLSSLIKRASDDGVDPHKLADAMDSNNPKAAHIELIVARASVDSRHLRHELAGHSLSKLHQRVLDDDLPADAVQRAVDADDPKSALVSLILAAALGPASAATQPGERPHFGSGIQRWTEGAKMPTVQLPQQTTNDSKTTNTSIPRKHVMLSYQWDHQPLVKRVHGLLEALGLQVWMDISGGMGSDVYESMAEGVSNASVVVCFMSQKYQESTNCML